MQKLRGPGSGDGRMLGVQGTELPEQGDRGPTSVGIGN